jgi:hypothetical protein
MIDFVREVELMSLHHECHNDIVECMWWHVEIAWNAVYLEITLKLTTLFLFQFFFHLVKQVHAILNMIKHRHLWEYFTCLSELLFKQWARYVDYVCPHDILHVEAEYITWHPWKHDVHINVQSVIMMWDVHQHVTLCSYCQVLADLCHTQHEKNYSTDKGDNGPAKGWLRQVLW